MAPLEMYEHIPRYKGAEALFTSNLVPSDLSRSFRESQLVQGETHTPTHCLLELEDNWARYTITTPTLKTHICKHMSSFARAFLHISTTLLPIPIHLLSSQVYEQHGGVRLPPLSVSFEVITR